MKIREEQKVVVITGSSNGIGREIAKKFLSEEYKVVMTYLTGFERVKKFYEEIDETKKENCLIVKTDVRNLDDIKNLYKKTLKKFGKVDILINNVGICDDNLIGIMKIEQWENVINTNLNSVFFCSKYFSKNMIRNKSGKIINISSLKGEIGSRGQVNYCASKAGVIGFTKALAKELGVFNIAVNAICPGFIQTDLNKNDIHKKKCAIEMSCLNYSESLSDLVEFVLFLSSNKIKSVSGRIFNLDSRIN